MKNPLFMLPSRSKSFRGEEEEVAAICTTDQSIQIQPTGWVDTEKPTNETNHKDTEHKDNSGDYQCGRD